MEKFLEGEEPTVDELKSAIRKATICMSIFPVLMGSSFKNKGVQTLLDAVVDYLPSPLDIPPMIGHDPDDLEKELIRKPDDNEPFSALGFKIMTDPFVGQLIFIRNYSGTLKTGDSVLNPRTRKTERIGRLLKMHANKREEVTEILAGDICAAVGLKNLVTGDTICTDKAPDRARVHRLPGAGHRGGRRAEDQGRPGKDGHGAGQARAGGSYLPRAHRPDQRPDHHQRYGRAAPGNHRRPHDARAQGRSQRRQAAGQLPRDDPSTAEAEGKYIRQSGGSGNYGHAKIRIEPNETGKGYEFSNDTKGGSIPKEYIKPIDQGIQEAMAGRRARRLRDGRHQGVLYDGSYHDVDSNEMAFKIAGSMAFKEAARKPSRCCSSL